MQEIPERIAIAGAGVAGAWLYRALTDQGRNVDLYGAPERTTACGIHPCAWGVSADFFRWTETGRLRAREYITNRVAWVDFEGRRFPAEVYLIHKPRLIRDLLDGAEVRTTPIPAGRYDRVLDCTGAARAYLPPTERPDIICPTLQMRMEIPDLPDDTIVIRYGKAGYCWVFPLGGHRFHVGAGAFVRPCPDLRRMLEWSGLLEGDGRVAGCRAGQRCSCESAIRMTGPIGALPHVDPDSPLGCPIWGVGEAIGTVSPITGEGITHAIRCAALYLAHERDPGAYSDAVIREFSWMAGERGILEKATARRWVPLPEWRFVQQDAASMGIHVGIPDALAILGTMVRQRRVRISSLVPRYWSTR
jgi:flavin-dependent dehydrogenase